MNPHDAEGDEFEPAELVEAQMDIPEWQDVTREAIEKAKAKKDWTHSTVNAAYHAAIRGMMHKWRAEKQAKLRETLAAKEAAGEQVEVGDDDE